MDVRAATDFVLGSSLINLWVGHAGPELTIIKSVVSDFERLNPGIRVEVTGGVTDERIHEAMESDDPPTVVSFGNAVLVSAPRASREPVISSYS